MDYYSAASSTSRAAVDTVPPSAPPLSSSRQSRHQQSQTSLSSQHSSSQSRRAPLRLNIPGADDRHRIPLPPGSPEVISSLITSLSIISEPASSLFEGHGQSVPPSPGEGSFGVDYGAFTHKSLTRLEEEVVTLDELAASPPVIRTAPPPSGFSTLTSPKSPRSPHRESSSSALKSLRRSSRPSSRGSASSSHDDSRSIGNLSVERGLPPTPELRRQRSLDSWSRKTGRNAKGLMAAASKERLRPADGADRKSIGLGAASFSRSDPPLAELAITEEPANTDWLGEWKTERSPSFDSSFMQSVPAAIPIRDSSLRKTGANATRASHRSSKSKRGGDGTVNDSILESEGEEQNRSRDPSATRKTSKTRRDSKRKSAKKRDEEEDFFAVGINLTTARHSAGPVGGYDRETVVDDGLEDSAPFPSVYSTRRRSVTGAEWRKSGHLTPDPGDTLKAKRSSSRVKRLSGLPKNQDDEARPTTPEPQVAYERPRSADSIDDSVQSYMTSPRLSQKIRHPQTGRVISFSEVGDPEGSAVFCCVGMGLTRYITAFYDELACTLKLRLITPDRPGIGDSEPYADGTATPLSWPDDVYAICQSLKVTKFSILAHSAGAIYALATALRMPQHIRGRIHLLAPWIPPSQMNVFGTSQALPPTNAIPTSQRILRALPTPFLKAANSSFMTATSSSLTSSLPKTPKRTKRKSTAPTVTRRDVVSSIDKENFEPLEHGDRPSLPLTAEHLDQLRAEGEYRNLDSALLDAATDAAADKERQLAYDTRLTHVIWELATTGANPAVDLLICLERRHTIGFRYVDITRPVVIHHGSRDNRVPVDNVRWLGKTMRRCEVRVLEGEGHGLMASATVMGSVFMEIAKEWEDWNRATGNNNRRDGEKERGRRPSVR